MASLMPAWFSLVDFSYVSIYMYALVVDQSVKITLHFHEGTVHIVQRMFS